MTQRQVTLRKPSARLGYQWTWLVTWIADADAKVGRKMRLEGEEWTIDAAYARREKDD